MSEDARRIERVSSKPYGFICPGCLRRYGPEQADKFIDVKRCAACHKTVADIQQYDEAIRSRRHLYAGKGGRK